MRLTPHSVRKIPQGSPSPDEPEREVWLVSYTYWVAAAKLQQVLGLLECRLGILLRLGLLDRAPDPPEECQDGGEVRVVVLLRWSSVGAFEEGRAAQGLAPYERLLASLCSRITIRDVGGATPRGATEVLTASGE